MPFITTTDTIFEGRVAAWREEDGKPCVYETKEEAEADANDVGEDDEPDMVIEVAVTESSIIDPIDGRVYWSNKQEEVPDTAPAP